MREDREIAKLLTESGPSRMATQIVIDREKQLDAQKQLRLVAKDMGIGKQQLAAEIEIARMMETDSSVTTNSANTVTRLFVVSSDGTTEIDSSYGSKLESERKRKFEPGYTELELIERQAIVRARILAEHATRPDYKKGRELLERIGHDKAAVISSMPDNDITVYAVKHSINPRHAAKLQDAAITTAEKIAARIAEIEAEIASETLNGKIHKVPPYLQRELNRAETAMLAARRRLDRANLRVTNSELPSAEKLVLEKVATIPADSDLPGSAAIESLELPRQIIHRPFREVLRYRTRSFISPVECAVLGKELAREQKAIREQLKADYEKLQAEKHAAELAEAEIAEKKRNDRTANNAAFKMAEAERKRNSRKNKNRAPKMKKG
jgi:hypothetical protein